MRRLAGADCGGECVPLLERRKLGTRAGKRAFGPFFRETGGLTNVFVAGIVNLFS